MEHLNFDEKSTLKHLIKKQNFQLERELEKLDARHQELYNKSKIEELDESEELEFEYLISEKLPNITAELADIKSILKKLNFI